MQPMSEGRMGDSRGAPGPENLPGFGLEPADWDDGRSPAADLLMVSRGVEQASIVRVTQTWIDDSPDAEACQQA